MVSLNHSGTTAVNSLSDGRQLAEEIERQERYLLDASFTQDEIDDIRFDAAFAGMMDKMNVA